MSLNKLFPLFSILLLSILLLFSNSLLDSTQAIKGFSLGILHFLVFLVFLFSKVQIKLWPSSLLQKIFLIYFLFLTLHYFLEEPNSNGIMDVVRIGIGYLTLVSMSVFFKKNSEKNLNFLFQLIPYFQFVILLLSSSFALANAGLSIENLKFDIAPFFSENILSQILLFTIPFSFLGLKKRGKWGKRFVLLSVVSSCLFIISLSSIAVYIALTINIIAASFFLIDWKESTLWMAYRKIILPGSTLLLVALLFLISPVIKKEINANSVQIRFELWELTGQGISERPFWGHGFGTWSQIHPAYTSYLNKNESLFLKENVHLNYLRPHNDFLWIWFEQGIFGLLIYLALLAFAIYLSIKGYRKHNDEYRHIYIASLLFLFSYTVFSLFSFPRERYEHLIFLVMVLAIISSNKSSIQTKFDPKRSSKIASLLMLGLAGFCLYYSYLRFLGETRFSNTLKSFAKNEWLNVLKQGKDSKNYTFQIASNGVPVDWYIGIANYSLSNFDNARSKFLLAKKDRPYQAFISSDLGSTYLQLNRVDSAEFYYRNAIELNKNYDEAKINLALLYYNQGKIEKALSQLNKIPLNSANKNFKMVYNAILEEQYSASFIQKARESSKTEKFNTFLINKNYPYFILLRKSIKDSISLDSLFNRNFEIGKLKLKQTVKRNQKNSKKKGQGKINSK